MRIYWSQRGSTTRASNDYERAFRWMPRYEITLRSMPDTVFNLERHFTLQRQSWRVRDHSCTYRGNTRWKVHSLRQMTHLGSCITTSSFKRQLSQRTKCPHGIPTMVQGLSWQILHNWNDGKTPDAAFTSVERKWSKEQLLPCYTDQCCRNMCNVSLDELCLPQQLSFA